MEQTEIAGGAAGRARPLGPRRGNGLLIVRGLLIALGAVLGVVLIAEGVVVVGAILLTMAALRVVMMVQLRRRRAWRRQHSPHLWARTPQRMP